MSDPRRLLDGDADEFESELLRSVEHDSMSPGSRRRILAALSVGGAIVTTSAVAGSSALGGQIGFFEGVSAVALKWIGICSVVGLVPTGVWVAHSHRALAPSNGPAPSSAVMGVGPPVAKATNDGSEAKPSSAPARAAPVRAVAPRDPKATPRVGPSPASGSPASLGDEVAALQAARAALANQDSNGALGALDRYKARFPSGRLAPEAKVLRIEALVRRGDRSQASALANQFESSSPESPYAERIDSMLGRVKAKSSR